MMMALNAASIIPPQSRQAHQVFIMVTMMFFLHAIVHPAIAIVRRERGEFDADIVNKVVCQGEVLKIKCPNSSYAINILGGSYGRTQAGNIVCPYQGSESDFYYNCGENDVTEKLKKLCRRKKKCSFEVGKAVFGDPCRGHAYLTIIYSCVKRKRKKNKPKTSLPTTKFKYTMHPTDATTTSTTNTLHHVNTTKISTTLNYTMNLQTDATTTTSNSSVNSTLINNDVGNVLSAKRKGDGPGILMSIIIWFVYVANNGRSLMTVFLITFGSATFLFLLIFGLMFLHKRFKDKKRRKKKNLDNSDAPIQNLNTIASSNCDVKKKSDLDTLSNTFPAPPPALPPPPDDLMYPSPSPDMINSSRPPPPPAIRGRSLDDISKIGQDTKKHVTVTRSISLRTTRPPDYNHKEVNFDKLPNIDSAGEIQAVIIQRNNGSTMYMNPMYENGHIKEVTC
ncbi:uncharacterized protein LOC116295807 [Actinia tenebrosa]|uniref:Uncharacterized protein LOC116295807 n=1 Tax=Actinia tenebrosa TaxID=6105 RepID=A0A6P8I3V9_ACTTE|nr:uncharacterized protein LOC116295807 [Actinia tenebrosa]XP_031559607.1 uncharacterized protein LOC116295807 [Actinia tenebrosa]XP_031559608.1 uncharacterized protein LOC116295807 [Actinia tenebrosa]